MPQREPSAYIWDIRDACITLREGLAGVGRDAYLADTMRRLAAERLLITIGEAMSQLAKVAPTMASELGDAAKIIAFRNILVHGYFRVDHDQVWQILTTHLPELAAAADRVWSRFAPLYEVDSPETGSSE